MKKSCGAIVVAAGSAQRMQGIDKMLTPLLGVPVLLRSVRALAESSEIDRIYIVTREDLLEKIKVLCAGEPKVAAVLPGGASRGESVLRGILASQEELVAIHDGARPLVSQALIAEAVQAAAEMGAAAPAIPVHDTIKAAKDSLVTQTPDRSSLYAVQTPQVFRRELILGALQTALSQKLPLTDDCSAAEMAGHPVRLTRGSEENLKITVPTDLILAEAILKRRECL